MRPLMNAGLPRKRHLRDSLFRRIRKTTTADAQGKFAFANLPQGEYIARSVVTWETGATYGGVQGGVVASMVNVGGEHPNDVVVSTQFLPDDAAALGVEVVSNAELSRPHSVIARMPGRSCPVKLWVL